MKHGDLSMKNGDLSMKNADLSCSIHQKRGFDQEFYRIQAATRTLPSMKGIFVLFHQYGISSIAWAPDGSNTKSDLGWY
jgi:hypothetical protein